MTTRVGRRHSRRTWHLVDPQAYNEQGLGNAGLELRSGLNGLDIDRHQLIVVRADEVQLAAIATPHREAGRR